MYRVRDIYRKILRVKNIFKIFNFNRIYLSTLTLKICSLSLPVSTIIQNAGVIVDMDGFHLSINYNRPKFLCKELGVSYIYKDVTRGYTFSVGKYSSLSPSSQRTATWVMRNVHGMKFVDEIRDRPQDSVIEVLLAIQAECILDNKKFAIAYKGGNFEYELLEMAGIPSYNLEDVGCPKYEKLTELYEDDFRSCCNLHKYANPSKIIHCPQNETRLFRKWLLDAFNSR